LNLVYCKPYEIGPEFAENSAWYLSTPLYSKKYSYSLEAGNAPSSFLKRAYDYAKLSAYKYIA
jgi:hypothetical protein